MTLRNVLPDWGARLIVGSLLLPALLAALDAFFRARRRRVPIAPWVAWLAVAAVPLPVAWLWLRALGATEVIEVPDGPVLPHLFPLETSGIVAMVSALLAGALACWLARFLAGALRGRAAEDDPRPTAAAAAPVPGVDGLAVATGVWICALAAITWAMNPYAAGVLVLATHLWLFAAGGWRGLARARRRAGRPRADRARRRLLLPRARPRPARPRLGRGAGRRLGLRPVVDAAARGRPGRAGGRRSACCSRAAASRATRRPAARGIKTRGPVSYAGPGSLGGTESALRR